MRGPIGSRELGAQRAAIAPSMRSHGEASAEAPASRPDRALDRRRSPAVPRRIRTSLQVPYCVRGRIVFHTAGGDIELGPGDKMILPPHTAHAAMVGA